MTKRDFFRIIIKIFGLYSLILTVFIVLPTSMGYITDFDPTTLLWIFGITVLIVLMFAFLIYNTDKIINLLKLHKGFDDDRIELGNFNNEKILQFALILIGGFLFLGHLPDFLQYCYPAFKKQVAPNGLNFMEGMAFGSSVDYFNWAISGMNLIMGYLILTNYNRIATWATRKEKNVW